MSRSLPHQSETGLIGPVCFWLGLLLMAALPWWRGGNRHMPLSLWVPCAALGLGLWVWAWARKPSGRPRWGVWHGLLVLAPVLTALIQLTPLPGFIWTRLAGREPYAELLSALGTPLGWRPLSLAPELTQLSLGAGLLLTFGFVLGASSTRSQLRLTGAVVVAVATLQCVLALAQFAGGADSPLYFGAESYGVPVGSWANRNHLANYLVMSLLVCVWLAWGARASQNEVRRGSRSRARRAGRTARGLIWVGVVLWLLLTILLTRSRGALLLGLPFALVGLVWVWRGAAAWGRRSWLKLGLAAGALVLGAVALVGLDLVSSRLLGDQLASSARNRSSLAWSSLEGAWALFPWGSGLGTYGVVYPRFQPADLPGQADHAHNDLVELLFEAGLWGGVLLLALLVLVLRQVWRIGSQLSHRGSLSEPQVRTALFGLGLMGFAAHSFVDFHLHIPANAVLAAWMLGVFLRTHRPAHSPDDRPSLPHPSGY